MMQNFRNRRSVHKCAQTPGSNVQIPSKITNMRAEFLKSLFYLKNFGLDGEDGLQHCEGKER